MQLINQPVRQLRTWVRRRLFPPAQQDAAAPDLTAYYHRLRAEEPITWHDDHKLWLLTRYADVRALLREPAFKQVPILASRRAVADIWLSNMNPPEHTHLRSWLNQGFTPNKLEKMRPRIQALAEQLIDEVQERRSMDLVNEYANVLPSLVVADFMRLPLADVPMLTPWVVALPGVLDTNPTPESLAPVDRAIDALNEYFAHIVEDRRQDIQDDPVSLLLTFRGPDGPLTEEVILANCILILWGGQITASHTLANGMLTLLQYPAHLTALKRDPALLAPTVDELFRFLTPVSAVLKRPTTSTHFHGHTFAEDQTLCPMLSAANRDPAKFPHPDDFDPGRADNNHLAFGYGPHHCIGEYLGRMIVEIGIETLLRRLPNLAIQSGAGPSPHMHELHSLKSLPITF